MANEGMRFAPTNLRLTLVVVLSVTAVPEATAAKDRLVRILFDAGHSQRFLPGGRGPLQLNRLASMMRNSGVDLQVHRGPITPAALAGAGGVWIAGPFRPYTKAEIDALVAFVEGGGRIVAAIHIGQPLAKLLWRFDVSISNGVLRDATTAIGGRPKDFRASPVNAHALTRGIKSVAYYGAWALLGRGKQSADLLATSKKAWVDLNRDGQRGAKDPVQRFSVAVLAKKGHGEVVVFGDDAVFQDQFLRGHNKRLVTNLARWLTAANRPRATQRRR